ncbi:MAG: ABC transporter ATP-binding protein, partial [Nonomuraea sp.]|nr:ABC transporter ATP-binding protein [Nonomuraea sp.]
MAELTVDGLVVDYGPVRALDGVSLRVPSGSVVAVLGANGAGK